MGRTVYFAAGIKLYDITRTKSRTDVWFDWWKEAGVSCVEPRLARNPWNGYVLHCRKHQRTEKSTREDGSLATTGLADS